MHGSAVRGREARDCEQERMTRACAAETCLYGGKLKAWLWKGVDAHCC